MDASITLEKTWPATCLLPTLKDVGNGIQNALQSFKDGRQISPATQYNESPNFYLSRGQRYRGIFQTELAQAGRAFKPTNVIHEVMRIESELFCAEDVKAAYLVLGQIKTAIKAKIKPGMTPREMASLILPTLKEMGFKVGGKFHRQPLISSLLNKDIDCDLFATIVIAVAQEEGWPVRMVLFDHHAAARYEDGRGEKFYIDLMGGEPGPPEERYTDEWGTKDFRVVSDNGVKACAHERLGYEYRNQEKYDLAIKHDEAAIGLEPKHAGAIANLGLTFFAYGKYIGFEKALEYYRKADKLLSQAISLSNVEKIKGYMLIEQAGVKDLLGDQSGAIECLTLAIKTLEDSGYFWNSDYEKAYLYRAGIKAYVLDYQGAKADIEVVIAEGKKKGEERKKLTDRIAEYEKLDEQQSLARKIEMSSSLRFAYLIRGPIF